MRSALDGYVPVDIAGISAGQVLAFDLYQLSMGTPRLFRNAEIPLEQEDLDSLLEYGCDTLFVPESQQDLLIGHQIGALPRLLRDSSVSAQVKMEKLSEISSRALERVLIDPTSKQAVQSTVDQCHNHVELAAGGDEEQDAMRENRPAAPKAIAHAVAVCNLSILLGIQIGIEDGKELHALATGALLHEVGKQLVDPKYYSRTDDRVMVSNTRLRSYPILGSKMLRNHKCVPAESLRVISEHQERLDGTGFPKHLRGSEIGSTSRILAVCDAFDEALHTDMSPGGRTPFQILMSMKRTAGKYDEAIFRKFVKLLGSDTVAADSLARS
ncbi:MAG: HD domain-containing phosphohydrolase [bacterium]